MSRHLGRLANVGLRVTTLAIRFLLVFFLARYLDPADLGYYGLFTATVTLALYVIGLDFYVFTTREVLRRPEGDRAPPVKAQIALSGLLYLIALPLAAAVLVALGWPGHLIWWFTLIAVLEHVNQEVFRLLIALSRQITASLLMFARQGSWAIAAVAVMALRADARSLDLVLALWAASGLVTAVLGVWAIRHQQLGGWQARVDWSVVWSGVKVSLAFLIATMALRTIQTLDRYGVEYLNGIESVAAYVLFLGVAGALLTFLDAGVLAYAYPALIALCHQREFAAARRKLREMAVQTVAICLGFSVISWLILPYLLAWIGNPLYQDAVGLYPWLLGAVVLNALGMIPHYALYASGHDRQIIYSHLAALPVFLVSAWGLGQIVPDLAVPIALAMSFALILLWKSVAYLRCGFARRPDQPHSE
ncbi:lipopolysaccharide biosynthesis protein [Paracoccus sp. p4-l81]|uniref:lipopolysaccharide biosynthesis protein n=1 Tax=Paracoccus sp. p4-l81 TaxID=3342806 RepID=UPI0035BA6F20